MTALVIALGTIAAVTIVVGGWLWFSEDLKQTWAARAEERRRTAEEAERVRELEAQQRREAAEAVRAEQTRRQEQEDARIRDDPAGFLQWSSTVDQTAVELINDQRVAEAHRDDARRTATAAAVPGWTVRTRGIALIGVTWVPITVVTTAMTFIAWLGLAAESSNRFWFAAFFAPVVASILITAGALIKAFHRPAVGAEKVRDRKRRWAFNVLLGFGVLLVAAVAVGVTDVVAQLTVQLFFDQQITAAQARLDALTAASNPNQVQITDTRATLASLIERRPKVAGYTAWLYVVVSIVEFITAFCALPAYLFLRAHRRAKRADRALEAAEADVRAAQQAAQAHTRRQAAVVAERIRGAGVTFDGFNAAVAAANTARAANTAGQGGDPAPRPAPTPAPAPAPGPRPQPRGPSPADVVEPGPPPANRWRPIVV